MCGNDITVSQSAITPQLQFAVVMSIIILANINKTVKMQGSYEFYIK